jgi:hypothetical protein
MQTASGPATMSRRTITHEPECDRGAELAPLTPAERIALTIALLNRGFDLMNGIARTSLTGHARTMSWGHHDPEGERHPYRVP